MNELSVKYNGVELSDYLIVTDVQRGIGADRTNKTIKVGNSDGERYLGSAIEKKTIPMSFTCAYDLATKRRTLANLLSVTEPKMLVFGDEPGKYYMAIPDGKVSLDEMVNLGKGVITWLVLDGVAHAVELSEDALNGQGAIEATNNGSYKSYPVLEAKMASDNGFIGFINQNGAILQFGNPDEPDTADYTESDRVIWDTIMIPSAEASRGWKTNDYQFAALWDGKHKLNANGTRKFGTDGGYGFVTPDSYGTGASGFKGITYGRKVSPDSQGHVGAKNFESRHGIWFESGNINQTGIFLTELRDKDGNAVCSIAFYKLSSSNNKAGIRINVKGNVKEWTFEPTAWNFYTKKGREFSIIKEEDTLRMHVGGVANGGFIHTVRLDNLTDVEVTDVVYYMGVPISGKPLSHVKLTHSTFRKDNVDKVRDIKNVFGEGDVITIDTAAGTATVNGIETLSLGALGNEYEAFALEPGANKIQCINSEWATTPVEYTIKWRDAYL